MPEYIEQSSNIVEARRATPQNLGFLAEWTGGKWEGGRRPRTEHWVLLRDGMRAFVGDWIILDGSKFRIVPNDIFQKTYKEVKREYRSGYRRGGI